MQAKDFRRIARENLSGMWLLTIGVAAVAALLGAVSPNFLPNLEYIIPTSNLVSLGENFHITLKTGLIATLGFFLGGTVELGYCQFLLKQYDHKNPQWDDLFSQFGRFGTGFAQYFLRGLYIFLWSLLFIIPGIIKSYAYFMTPYILADNPDMTASEAIARSKQMMDGHKMELFVLHLSFIGWHLLAALVANLGYLALNPYVGASTAAFYRNLLAQENGQNAVN